MAYKALYRMYRPDNFEEMAGQKHIVKTLENAIAQKQIAHAYLFCGPRGTGKTSSAKIFAKAINCESSESKPCGKCPSCLAAANGTHPDIIEIDAASNNGVEEARNLIERVKYAPLLGKYKIYIIDEVHMMSTGAFNALLKTIEEPPAHIIFILATTEPYKVIPTIISRCQRFDFSKITKSEIVKKLRYIVDQEKIEVEEKVLENIAILADGGMRDALSILDQCRAYSPNKITVQDVNDIYGVVSMQELCDIFEYAKYNNTKMLMNKIEELDSSGADIKRLTTDLIEVLKESIIYDYSKDEKMLDVLTIEQVRNLKKNTTTADRLKMIDILVDTYEKFKQASNVVSYFEIAMLKIMEINKDNKQLNEIEYQSKEQNQKEEIEIKNQEDISEYGELEIEEDIIETIDEVISEDIEMNINETNEEVVVVENHPEPIIVEEKKQEIKVRKKLSNEYVVQLLVGANKPEKMEDNEKMRNIDTYTFDLNYAKYANLLKNCNIIASASQYIILCVETMVKANEINELDKNSEFLLFTEELLKKKKKVFALVPDQRDEIIEEFIRRKKEDNLPEAITFEFKETIEEEKKEDNQIENVKSLFKNVEIMED
ncbi:MAG: DNA polymerase III subunit gamma/tau [Bacilli bacterium]|nr:DNA polymerase III subunit gamma/tau [Bacilli bacterium]